jgi:hypothetical protein
LRAEITGERFDFGGAYTLGKDGAVADGGLDVVPKSPIEFVGESGGGKRDASVILDSEKVRSSD